MKKGLVIVDAWCVEEAIEPIRDSQIPKWSSEVRENVNRFSEYLDYVCDYERGQGTTIIHCLGLAKSEFSPMLDVKPTSQVKIKKGDIVTNTGEPILVPVGPETLGRIINVIGEPIDEKGPVKTKEKWPIHRQAPKFTDQSTETEMLVTGIKVIDKVRRASHADWDLEACRD